MSAKCVDISDRHQLYKIWVIEQNLIFPCAFYTNEALLTSHFTPLHDPSTTAIAHAKLCGSIPVRALYRLFDARQMDCELGKALTSTSLVSCSLFVKLTTVMRHVAAGSCGEEHAVPVFKVMISSKLLQYSRLTGQAQRHIRPGILFLVLQDIASSDPLVGKLLPASRTGNLVSSRNHPGERFGRVDSIANSLQTPHILLTIGQDRALIWACIVQVDERIIRFQFSGICLNLPSRSDPNSPQHIMYKNGARLTLSNRALAAEVITSSSVASLHLTSSRATSSGVPFRLLSPRAFSSAWRA